MRLVSGLGLPPGGRGMAFQPLVSAGGLAAALSFSRASTAALIRSTDGALVEVGNNVPRFDPALGLLMTAQRTGSVSNPRWEGAVTGTPGTLPTGTGTFTAPSGITRQVVGVVTANGVPELQIRFSGTPSSGGEISFYPLPSNLSVVPGDVVTQAVRARMVAGSLTNVSAVSMRTLEFLSGSYVREGSQALALTGALQPFSLVRTMGAGINQVVASYSLFGVSGQPLDITLGFALPDVALAPFAQPYAPILPPVGMPAATTRLADTLTASLASLGIPASGACTLVGTFLLPQADVVGAFPNMIRMDDGTSGNRFTVYNTGGGNSIQIDSFVGGVSVSSQVLGSMVPGIPFRLALSFNGSGGLSGSLNGGAALSISGGPSVNLQRLWVALSLNGYVQRLSYLPYAVPNAELRALARPDAITLIE